MKSGKKTTMGSTPKGTKPPAASSVRVGSPAKKFMNGSKPKGKT